MTSVRVSSSTSIQTCVSTCLSHLAEGTSNGPITLHTLPATISENTEATAAAKTKAKKTAHASLGKLVSIVEIVKREFEGHQREQWKLAGIERRKQDPGLGSSGSTVSKGKKRARDGDDVSEEQAGQVVKPKKVIMRIYQYNELDCLEGNNNASQSDEEEDANGGMPAQGKDATEIDAKNAHNKLDQAIQDQAVRGRWRRRKSHVPTLRITLSTVRLLAFEKKLVAGGKQWTLQYPPKLKRARSRKKRAKTGNENGKDGEEEISDNDEESEEEEEDPKNQYGRVVKDLEMQDEPGMEDNSKAETSRQIASDAQGDALTPRQKRRISPSAVKPSTQANLINPTVNPTIPKPQQLDQQAVPGNMLSDSQATQTSGSTDLPMATAPEAAEGTSQ